LATGTLTRNAALLPSWLPPSHPMQRALLPFASGAAAIYAFLRARSSALAARTLTADPAAASAKRAALLAAGFSRLHVVIDFDRTITTYLHNGAPGATCHGVLEGRRPPAVLAQAAALKLHYLPIELCPTRTAAEKVPHMIEWYTRINAILAGCGITRADLAADVAAAQFSLRGGVAQLLAASARHGFPVTVFSAGVADVIEETLRARCYGGAPLPPTLRVISNRMQWSAEGVCTGFHPKVLHPFNKDFVEAAEFVGAEAAAALAGRDCVVVVGDGEGDARMAVGLAPAVEYRVGLVNDASRAEQVARFRELFDVVCACAEEGGGGSLVWHAAAFAPSHTLTHTHTHAPRRLPPTGLSDPPLWPLIDLLAEMESSSSAGEPSRKGASSVASSGDATPSSISV
jgi:HAD superfamily hydrolase (TIGR01544 family)